MATRFMTKNKRVIPIGSTSNTKAMNSLSPSEMTYKNNKRLIQKYGLKVNTILTHKELGHDIKITSIHPLYGWVVSEPCDFKHICREVLNQDMRNIDNFRIQR